jgi:hypothetical protein
MEKYFKYGFFIAVLAVVALTFKMCSDQKSIKDVKIEESNLRKALADTLHHFQTKEGDWGAEKLTMQTELSNLQDKNLVLSENQKTLVKQVEQQNKTSQTIAAALIELTAKVEGLTNEKPIHQTDSSVQFAAKTPDFEYDLTVFNVKPFELKTPTLTLNRIAFPNKQTVNFHWKDDRKEGYPVSFSVVNTNQYFKVTDIQSYAIPELTREKVKPTFWQKVGQLSKTTGGKIVTFAIGAGVGFGVAQQFK